jgi:hypothetical protein
LALILHPSFSEVCVNSTRYSRTGIVVLVLTLVAGLGGAIGAQSNVSSTEIQRLQDDIYDASRDVAQLRSRDASAAAQLQT